MTTVSHSLQARTDGTDRLGLPQWVHQWMLDCTPTKQVEESSVDWYASLQSDDYVLVGIRIAHASALAPDLFEQASKHAYLKIRDMVNSSAHHHIIRLWNFIPGIHHSYGAGLDRYMVFNAGRYAAFNTWYGSVQAGERIMPTATGVGHDGSELHIYALAASAPGRPVENPRQVSAYHYSKRYGPKPPCFARATVINCVDGRDRILVGGTASVVGEDSRHEEDVIAQAHETFTNLSELIRSADGAENTPAVRRDAPSRLNRFTDLRIYYQRPCDKATLSVLVRENFISNPRIEWMRADLCRPELLVEIEGIADALT